MKEEGQAKNLVGPAKAARARGTAAVMAAALVIVVLVPGGKPGEAGRLLGEGQQ